MRAYTPVALLIAASLGLAHATAQNAAPAPAAPAPAAQTPITPKLTLIRELREADLRPKSDDGFIVFSSGGPGLRLSMSMDLPDGSKVSHIAQPKSIRAADDRATDLTQIEPGFSDAREWVSVEQWFDDPATLEVRLLAPPRAAETFTVFFETSITTYRGVEHADVDLIRKWTPLTHPSLTPLKAEYRITSRGNFEIRPVAARELIEGVIALSDDMDEMIDPPGRSVSWDDKTAEFSVDPAPEEGQKVRMWVRADVKTIPVRVDIADQKLP